MFPGRLEEAFDWYTRFVFLAAKEVRGRKLFACDELQNFVPSRELPQWFAAVLQTGRIYELDAAYIAIAPNMCHQQIRAHASECVAFNPSESGAVDLLTAEWGFNREELRRLPKFHFIARKRAGGEVRGVIRP